MTRMLQILRYAVLTLVGALALLTSCSDDSKHTPDVPLKFKVDVSDEWQTIGPSKAAPVTSASGISSFGILSFAYNGSWTGSETPNYIYNVEVEKDESTDTWPTNYYWPAGKTLRFFAYAPYNAPGVVLSAQDAAGIPTIAYTVPSDIAAQADLLFAAPAETGSCAAVPLTFDHALTAIKFASSASMMEGFVTIKSISLTGIPGTGTMSLADGTWSSIGTTATYTLSGLDHPAVPGTAITTDAQTFMMIPQPLPSGAQISVTYYNAVTAAEETVTANLSGSTWTRSTTVTYSITITPYGKKSIAPSTHEGFTDSGNEYVAPE